MSGWIFIVMGVLQLALGFCLGVAWTASRYLRRAAALANEDIR